MHRSHRPASRSGVNSNAHNNNMNNPIPITSDTDSDSSPAPASSTSNRRHQTPTTATTNTKRNTTSRFSTRMHTREVRHTAHCILSSKELLLLHALASNESVPRTRRRFLAQVLEPDDPGKALDVALDRTTTKTTKTNRNSIGGGGGGGGPVGAIPGAGVAGAGQVIDVVETDDDKGWMSQSSAYFSVSKTKKKKSASPSAEPSGRKRSYQQQQQQQQPQQQQQRVGSGSRPGSAGVRFASPLSRAVSADGSNSNSGRRERSGRTQVDDSDGDVEMEDL